MGILSIIEALKIMLKHVKRVDVEIRIQYEYELDSSEYTYSIREMVV